MHFGSALAVLSFVALVLMPGPVPALSTSRVSLGPAGLEASDSSDEPSIAADGRWVAFQSSAENLVPGDTNGQPDIFVHDSLTGVTSRVSVSSVGAQGGARSDAPSISADGRYVAFHSAAADLVPGDTNNREDVFVHDRQTGETSLVSVSSGGAQGNAHSLYASISADGRFVAFESDATNLVQPDTNRKRDVLVHDRQTGETSRVSVDATGVQGNRDCANPAISADGRFVAFDGLAANLVPGDTNLTWDVFVHDRQLRSTSRASEDSAGVQANSGSIFSAISADGRFVAFWSEATNLVQDDTNDAPDAFVHDRETGETRLVSVDSAGIQGNGSLITLSISADGRFVAFASWASNLVPGDTNADYDIFVRDLQGGETSRVSVDSAGIQADAVSSSPSISADGSFVAFRSLASNLVPGDTNSTRDIFVHKRIACRSGNVNSGAGAATDVLFVNDSSGGPERTVRLLSFEPLTIFVAAPPSATRAAPFALYAWPAVPDPNAPGFALPLFTGATCLPTPLTGGTPAPRVVWNNTGSDLAGTATRPSSPAPSIVVRLPRGLGRPATGYLQGIILDRGAPNGRAAVTNGVAIEIR